MMTPQRSGAEPRTRQMTENLASFDDRLTMRHVREYPHPIGRVWDAVTTTEHLEVWLLPASQIERRQGGTCRFSWGGPVDDAQVGTVSVFDPPREVRYQVGESYIAFELEELGPERTRLTFLQHFAPGEALDQQDWDGADQPAGPDSPWRPGFVGGFHGFLDQLGTYLDGGWTREKMQPVIDAVYEGRPGTEAWETHPDSRSPANDPKTHGKLIEIYREHIREHCPPA